MVFFRRALAQCGQACIAGTQDGADAADEHHRQRRHQHEAQQKALHVGVGQAAGRIRRQVHRTVAQRQPGHAQAGHCHQQPAVATRQQHRAQHHLQQVQEHERIDDAATQVQLRSERGHIHQQRRQQCTGRAAAVLVLIQQAEQVEYGKPAHHQQHRLQGQGDAQAVMDHADGQQLPDHGDPAQQHQLLHVAGTHAGGRAGVGLSRDGVGQAVDRHRAYCAAAGARPPPAGARPRTRSAGRGRTRSTRTAGGGRGS